MSIGIEGIEYYLPSRIISSEQLANDFGFPLPFVEEKIGVRQLFVAAESENTSDLAVAAIKKLFSARPEIKDRIQVLVVCTQTPDFQLPHTSAIVQQKLGLSTDIACFDVGLGCSGFVYGLSVMTSFMQQNDMEYGLLVTAETYSKIIDDHDRSTKPLFSDAAAVTLIGRNPVLRPGKFTFGTDGKRFQSLIVDRIQEQGRSYVDFLKMDGRGIFEMVVSEVPGDIERCLSKNNITKEEIDCFVFHQASLFMLDTLIKRMDIKDAGKVVKCIDRFGNTVSSSIPIALKTIVEDADQVYRKILISGFGVGASWASTILSSNQGKK